MAEQFSEGAQVWYEEHAIQSFKRWEAYQRDPSLKPATAYQRACVELNTLEEATDSAVRRNAMSPEQRGEIVHAISTNFFRLRGTFDTQIDIIVKYALRPLNRFLAPAEFIVQKETK
jgi:hypothetical protein